MQRALHAPETNLNVFADSRKNLLLLLDNEETNHHNNRCCIDVRPYLSWIEGLTTNQYVVGSNPTGRTILQLFLFYRSREGIR